MLGRISEDILIKTIYIFKIEWIKIGKNIKESAEHQCTYKNLVLTKRVLESSKSSG